ncbi:tryptophan-rich sensory protein, partial [Candidatus Shapirobacteria bacterium]|nr:tryptophan-rich sensory protein [Candidatus Shapirobacteria bacterium]
VWTTLFLLMGLALYIVWNKKGKTNNFWIQLGLNLTWSLVFFGLESPLWGIIVIILLWEMIRRTMVDFGTTSKTASWLLLPYLMWVSFATLLNVGIWWVN